MGNGLTVKAGKWATLIGYEVYESPKNLNFSRSFLYTLGTPYTHTGLLVTYPVAPWFSVTAGFTNGWDNADNNNGYLRPIGSFAFTPAGKNVNLWEVTATAEYKIWRGLVGRVEFRHDEANPKAFSLQGNPPTPTSNAQNTITLALYYSFF